MMRKSLKCIMPVLLSLVLIVVSEAAAKTKIVMLHWEPPHSPLQQGIELFEKLNPDIEVELMGTGAYNDKVYTMAAGGVDFDVLYVSNDMYSDWINRGLLKDITPLMESDSEIGPESFLPIEELRCAVDGRWYGFGSSWSCFLLYYDRDLFAESGLVMPPRRAEEAWSWEEYMHVARKLTERDGDTIKRYGANQPTWWLMLESLILSNEGRFVNEEATKFLLDQPEAAEVFEAIAEGISSGVLGGWLGGDTAAMDINGSWTTGFDYSRMDIDVDIGVLPAFSKPRTFAQGHIHSIYSGTRNPNEAWRLLKFLASKDYQSLWVKGGVWLPATRELMTMDAFKECYDPAYMPEGYLETAVTYLQEAGRGRKFPVGWEKAMDVFHQNVSKIWNGESPAYAVLSEIVPVMNKMLEESRTMP